MTALTLVIVASRLYIRAGVLRNMGTDDWLIAASMVSLTQYAIDSKDNTENVSDTRS